MGVELAGEEEQEGGFDVWGAAGGVHEAAVGAFLGGEDLGEILVFHGGPIDMDRVSFRTRDALALQGAGFEREPLAELGAPILQF